MVTITDAEVNLRRATADDAETIAALNEHVQRLHLQAAPEQFTPIDRAAAQAFFATQLAGQDAVAWIADLSGQAVGYLYAAEAHRAANPFTIEQHTLYVHHMAVHPVARRQGVGSAMFAAAETYAWTHGLSGLRLDSWLFNEEAHVFFQRLGFEPFVTRFARNL
ncbi:GCN5-related N-acetyltransferase [Kineococcus radiotolerans SRS30216 = ATCC BAA-149]|uniref:GCN5-related N-acetyltransferase n=1 Tax=Kineococcus radiotolerans (strain ATCC BAA-149 / DSM 14245 / SRS30216) TaxID=266940 RepID=A6WA98_KINRD|nr:GCN5-related N-acetyltransferase [Kineococcus radiotolerans SRS30216 = ATCC BAA-149]